MAKKDEKKRGLLDAQSSVIEIMEDHQLKKWSKISPRVFAENSEEKENQVRIHSKSPFPVDGKAQ